MLPAMTILDRPDGTLTLADGRRLGVAEYGVASGVPVLHFHGSASSRLERPSSPGELVRNGVRFISLDRPGHGRSDYLPGRRLRDWVDDVREVANRLALDRFYVEGYSAGGPYALACAHDMPDRVIAVALIASAAPVGRAGALEGMPLPNRLLAMAARWAPPLTRLTRWVMRRVVLRDGAAGVRRIMALPEADEAVLDEPTHMAAFVRAVREGLAPGARGAARDDHLIHGPWGFEPAGVAQRVDVWHGDADVNVPLSAARHLADALPRARLEVLPGAGHFFLYDRWGDVLGRLVEGEARSNPEG